MSCKKIQSNGPIYEIMFNVSSLIMYFFIIFVSLDEKSDDFWATENTLKKHSILLSKGLSIQNGTLTISNILEYDIAIE